MMRNFFILFFLVLIAACSGKPSGPDDASLAVQAAKVYYDQLLKGDYESFVKGRYQPTAMPESLHRQLVANAKMFVAQQEKEHRGIKSVAVSEGRADTTHHVANAFLTFSYGDGTKEQVVVPMVEVKKVWYMR